ncbi:hypothetical protein EMIT0111MI5_20391 [Burkholderia sp. IT-111MI5]
MKPSEAILQASRLLALPAVPDGEFDFQIIRYTNKNALRMGRAEGQLARIRTKSKSSDGTR